MPILLAILLWIFNAFHQGNNVERSIANLCLMAFFFLLCPGEYCKGGTDTLSSPFRLLHVDFFIGERRFRGHQRRLSETIINAADTTSLCFNNQKTRSAGKRWSTASPCTIGPTPSGSSAIRSSTSAPTAPRRHPSLRGARRQMVEAHLVGRNHGGSANIGTRDWTRARCVLKGNLNPLYAVRRRHGPAPCRCRRRTH
uniref:Secreted protein n=1 Tax=Odontella aurita TaxID=265563 RepID=A0A7S4IHG2_9STRA